MARDPLILGERYLCVICANPKCGAVIPLLPQFPIERGSVFDAGLPLSVGCPFCGQTAEHQPSELVTRV